MAEQSTPKPHGSTLTDKAISRAKPGDKPYKLFDGGGLYLLVNPTGSKLWRLKYRHEGTERLLAIGSYPVVSLAKAREERDNHKRTLIDGTDPMAERKVKNQAKAAAKRTTFEAVARAWFAKWSPAKSPRHAGYVMRRLELDVFPAIGNKPVADIKPSDMVALMAATEKRGALDIARRNNQTCGQVFRYAVAHEMRQDNPVTVIRPADVLPTRKTTHYKRIDLKELPELMRRIEGYDGAAITRLAMLLMAHTFVRTGELIGARWGEIDLPNARWNIPAERMKMKTPHIVPLSAQVIALLQTLHLKTGHRDFLLPGDRDPRKCMSNGAILMALKRMGYKGRMTGHGFRGVASTALHEMNHRHDLIELQLAHQERNEVAAAYNHATYLPQRAEMMQAWSDYLSSLTAGNVVPISQRAA